MLEHNFDVLKTLQNYQAILTEELGISLLIKDGIFLSFIMSVLSMSDDEVIIHALDIIYTIISRPQYIATIKQITNIQNTFEQLELSKLFEKILSINYLLNFGKYLNCQIGQSKVFELKIEGLTKENTKLCQEILLQCRGVISFTFNHASNICIVRTRKEYDPHMALKYLNKLPNVKANLLIKNLAGEKIILPMDDDYLDKSGIESCAINKSPENKSTFIVKHGSNFNSNNTKPNSWFSSAKSFISESFFW